MLLIYLSRPQNSKRSSLFFYEKRPFFFNIVTASWFSIIGPPEFCIGNITRESQLEFTLCGVPKPNVTWGFIENDTNNFISATKANVYYAHNYSLSLNDSMCGKVIYFKAVGYSSRTLSWNTTHERKCESRFICSIAGILSRSVIFKLFDLTPFLRYIRRTR